MEHILHIDASARGKASVSRQLGKQLVQKLSSGQGKVTYRDVSNNLPFVTEEMIDSYFTHTEARSEAQQLAVALSDTIVNELKAADTIVIGIPIYNFSMPAGFKAWCDLAARVGETFRYTVSGPVGLLERKKAYVVIATGGTRVDSNIDFLTPWLRHYLGFIGIKEVEVIRADALNQDADAVIHKAQSSISTLTVRP